MKVFNTMAPVAALAASLAVAGGTLRAQQPATPPAAPARQEVTIPGTTLSMTATIEAIDQGTRTVTLKTDKGIYETIQAPPEMKRFNELKVGQKVTARYVDNVVVRVKKPGEAQIDVESAALLKGGKAPAAAAGTQRTLTVTITAMDPATSAVTVAGPNGYVYSRRVADKKVFAALKVGDKLDMTWTQALLVAVEPAK